MKKKYTSAKKRFLIFTGEGKGKTTAALGLILRAWGHDHRIAIVHFIKSRLLVGEVKAINKINQAKGKDDKEIDQFVMGVGFLPKPSNSQFPVHEQAALDALAQAKRLIELAIYDLLVLDEICWALHRKLLSEKQVFEIIDLQRDNTTLVFTGRYASEKLIAKADTVSLIENIKHAYQQNIAAQVGVEK